MFVTYLLQLLDGTGSHHIMLICFCAYETGIAGIKLSTYIALN